jgi:hypothetical protein
VDLKFFQNKNLRPFSIPFKTNKQSKVNQTILLKGDDKKKKLFEDIISYNIIPTCDAYKKKYTPLFKLTSINQTKTKNNGSNYEKSTWSGCRTKSQSDNFLFVAKFISHI